MSSLDKGDLVKAMKRLLKLVAKKMGKKLLPSALQDNKLIHLL